LTAFRCFWRAGATAIVLAVFGSTAAAQQKPEALEVDDVNLDALLERKLDDRLGTTTAVSKSKEDVLTAPAAITTISRDQIRLSGARTIPDLLRWVPGVQVFRNGPGNHIVSLRGTGGLNGNNVVVLVDSVPINSPLDGSVDWDLVPVHVRDLDRIEVVRGPVSTIYGANAYTGVVNIITRRAYGTSVSGGARAEIGADVEGGAIAGLSGRYAVSNDALRAGAFAGGEVDGTGSAGGETSDSARKGAVMTDVDIALSPSSRLILTHGGSRSTRGSLDHLVQEDNPQTRSLVLSSLRFRTEEVTSNLVSMDVWARNVAQFIETDPAAYAGFSYAHTRTNRAALGTDLKLRLVSGLDLTLGAEGNAEWIDAPYVNPTANDRVYYGYAFHGNVDYSPFNHLQLKFGGRGDVPAGRPELRFSYRGSLVYGSSEWAVRLAAASSYRAPSYVELGGRFVDRSSGFILLEGDPNLKPPTNQTVELGVIAAPVPTLHIMPTVYASRLGDAVVEDFEPIVRRTFRNDPSPRDMLGAELEATWQADEDLTIAAHFGTQYWLSVDETVTATVGVPGQTSTWVAGIRGFGSLSERLGYGLGANYAEARSFALRAGIPPRIIDLELEPQTHAFAAVEYALGATSPLWLELRVFAALPHDEPESPMPVAKINTTTGVLSLAYRED
jgi:outer membrane receptor protein involved in Fe transport